MKFNITIQFMDELVELASEENKPRAVLVKENFISDFERSYGYEKEVETEVTELPPYHIAAMPDAVQEEIKAKRKLLCGILNCADATIEKTEQLAAERRIRQNVKQAALATWRL